MAKQVRTQLNRIQSAGSIRLLAWGVAGSIAYEIAQQLIGEDRPVEFLAIIEARNWGGAADAWAASFQDYHSRLPPLGHVNAFDKEMARPITGPEGAQLGLLLGRSYNLPLSLDHTNEMAVDAEAFECREPPLPLHKYEPQPITIPVHFIVAKFHSEDRRTTYPNQLSFEVLSKLSSSPQLIEGDILTPDMSCIARILTEQIERVHDQSETLSADEYHSLMLLRSGRKADCNVVCIPGAGAGITSFMSLAETLDENWTIYGLQPRGLDPFRIPHSTVLAASQSYFNQLQGSALKGPIHLLGHSFGGWVSLTLAQMFLKVNRPVASLVLVDSNAPDGDDCGIREYDNISVLMKWIEMFELVLKRPLHITADQLFRRDQYQQLVFIHGALVRAGLMPTLSNPESLRGPLRSFATCLRTTYCPPNKYSGLAHLVLTDDSRKTTLHNQKTQLESVTKWKRWIPSMTSSISSADHLSILRPPFVEALADLLTVFRNDQRLSKGDF